MQLWGTCCSLYWSWGDYVVIFYSILLMWYVCHCNVRVYVTLCHCDMCVNVTGISMWRMCYCDVYVIMTYITCHRDIYVTVTYLSPWRITIYILLISPWRIVRGMSVWHALQSVTSINFFVLVNKSCQKWYICHCWVCINVMYMLLQQVHQCT